MKINLSQKNINLWLASAVALLFLNEIWRRAFNEAVPLRWELAILAVLFLILAKSSARSSIILGIVVFATSLAGIYIKKYGWAEKLADLGYFFIFFGTAQKLSEMIKKTQANGAPHSGEQFFDRVATLMDFPNRARFDFESALYRHGIIKDFERLVHLVGKNATILDLGCGKGHLTAYLRWLGLEAHGIDLRILDGDQQRIKDSHWRQNLWDKLAQQFGARYQVFDGTKIPYPDNHFDVVIAYAVLEHVKETHLNELLAETKRVLKPQGYLAIFRCPNRFSYGEKLARMMGLLAHEKLYSSKELKQTVFSRGFSLICWGRSDLFIEFPPRRLNATYNRLAPWLIKIEKVLMKTPLRLISHHLYLIAQKPLV